MKAFTPQKFKQKELIVFDMDGTLAESKSAMDREMALLLSKLLEKKKVAIISGGEFRQFKIQALNALRFTKPHYDNLFLFPATSTAFFRYQKNKWREVYAYKLSNSAIKKIHKAFHLAFHEIHYVKPKKVYGEVIDDRGTEVTFSALGQKVVSILGSKGVTLKANWAKKYDVRPQLSKIMQKLLPDYTVRIAGLTSIDVTRKGIDKGYGVRQIRKYTKIPISKMLFVGDAIFPGGNDYEALKTGIDYVKVKGPSETKKLVKKLIK
jgi:phosphomannomutase